jgi:hypothetical protein
MEECAEVIQAVTKILRHGKHSFNPDRPNSLTNLQDLSKELGHTRAALWLCGKYKLIDYGSINKAAADKARRLGKYLHHASAEGIVSP